MRLFNLLILLLVLIFVACEDDDQDNLIDLPVNIQTYLDTNYPNAEIEETEQDTLCTGVEVYEVEIEMNDDEEIELTFDTEGNLLFIETEIDKDQLPTAVKNAISANYADYTTEEAERLDLASGGNQYEVELKSSAQTLEVLFEANGTVICEQVDDEE